MNGRQEANQLLVNSLIKNRCGDNMPQIYRDFLTQLIKEKQPVTANGYSQWTKLFLEYCAKKWRMKVCNIGPDKIKKITEEDIKEYLISLESELKNEKGEKKSRERARLSWYSLNSFFKYLIQRELIDDNPVKGVKRPKKDRRKPKNYLSNSQIKQIFQNIETDIAEAEEDEDYKMKAIYLRNLMIMETLLTTGMRGKALTQIKISDFDWDGNKLTALDKGEKFFTYDLPDKYMQDLERYLEIRPLLLNSRESDYLFLSERSSTCIINYPTVYNIVKNETKRAGNEVSPHRLRATYGRTIYNATGDIFLTQQMMGHSTWQTTMLYLDSVTEERRQMANNIVSAAVFQS